MLPRQVIAMRAVIVSAPPKRRQSTTERLGRSDEPQKVDVIIAVIILAAKSKLQAPTRRDVWAKLDSSSKA